MSNLLDWSTCKLGCLHGTLFAASGSLLANYSKLASSKAQPYKLPVGLVWLAASFFRRTLTLNSILFRFSPSEKKIQMWAWAVRPFPLLSNMLLQGPTWLGAAALGLTRSTQTIWLWPGFSTVNGPVKPARTIKTLSKLELEQVQDMTFELHWPLQLPCRKQWNMNMFSMSVNALMWFMQCNCQKKRKCHHKISTLLRNPLKQS